MKRLLLAFVSISMLFAVSCQQEKTVTYTVASQSADCTGVAPQKCLLVKTATDSAWTLFYSQIEGFTHEEGFEYVLEVKEEKLENVPADAPSVKYVLVKEVSKTEKVSENLPEVKAEVKTLNLVGKVVSVEKKAIGVGAAEGKFEVQIVKVEVTSSEIEAVKAGDVVHCELVAAPSVVPAVGSEYVFKAKVMHPAHALGVYLLDTDVLDLI